MFPLPENTTIVEGVVRDVVVAVARNGLRPGEPAMAAVDAIEFDGLDLAGYRGSVELNSLELRVKFGAGGEGQPALLPDGVLLNRRARLRLADGTEVRSELAHFIGASSTYRDQKLVAQEGTIILDHWTRGPRPAVWLGKLEGAHFELGNLLIGEGPPEAPKAWSPSGFRFAGNYVWHVVGQGDDCVAVIECRDAALMHELVKSDFVALQLALGAPLRLGLLTGLDINMVAVATSAPMIRQRNPTEGEGANAVPPVPPWKERQCWAPVFSAAISNALNGSERYAFHLAARAYLDSTHEDVDSAYLKLQIALEAFCRTGDPPLGSLVSDPGAWRAWVRDHEGEILSFGLDNSAGRRLVAKVHQANIQRPSTDAVTAAFRRMGLDVPDAELEETLGRHLAAHRFFMNEDEDSRDMSRDLDRVAVVRTLLLAAVARRAGYAGPLYGWNGARFGEPRWWPVTAPTALAQHWYACLCQSVTHGPEARGDDGERR